MSEFDILNLTAGRIDLVHVPSGRPFTFEIIDGLLVQSSDLPGQTAFPVQDEIRDRANDFARNEITRAGHLYETK